MDKITYAKRDTTDKEGNLLVSKKTNKPYTRLTLKVESRGDKFIGGFENAETKSWKVGDEVDIVITENGQYLNWALAKKGAFDETLMRDIYSNTETILNKLVGLGIAIEVIKEKLAPAPKKDIGYDYPVSEDMPPEDMPF